MMSGANGDASRIQLLGNVVGVHSGNVKAHDPALVVGCGTNHTYTFHGA
jgi:hypothetical protein